MPVKVQSESRIYGNASTQKIDDYFSNLHRSVKVENGIFDSTDAVTELSAASGNDIPDEVRDLKERLGDGFEHASRAIFDSIASYEEKHGIAPSADLIQQALHSAGMIFDHAADNQTAYSGSLGQNTPIITITSTINEAVPFASYAPVNGQNEAIIGVINHRAQSDVGGYKKGESIDGDEAGRPYTMSQRCHSVYADGSADPITGKLTRVQTSGDESDQSAPGVPLVRGLNKVYLNGLRAAFDSADSTDTETILNSSGTVSIGGIKYTITGEVNLSNGEFSIASTPALPTGTMVTFEGSIDFNADDSLIPIIGVSYMSKNIKAARSSGSVTSNFESNVQFNNELALDPLTESMIALQSQLGVERHRLALNKMRRIARNHMHTVDLDFPNRAGQMNFADVWSDSNSQIADANIAMVSRTEGTAIGVGYTGKHMASRLHSLSREDFEPSGIRHRTGIYRIGRLVKHGFDVYMDPSITDSTAASQILCIGRHAEVARNAIVMGDYAGPQLSGPIVKVNGTTTIGYHSMSLTEANPLASFAQAACILNFVNMAPSVSSI